MPFARCSELDRLFNCYGSLVLPREADREGIAAAWGTKVHAWMETGQLPDDRDGQAIGKRITAAKVSRRKLWPEEGVHELALALDVVSGTVAACVVPTGHDARQYKTAWKAAFDDRWLVGSLDFAMELLGSPWVDDLKTGRWVSWQAHASQQSAYALMYTLYKYGEVRECRSTVTHWPKYPIANPPNRWGCQLSVDYLNDFLHRLRVLRDQILETRRKYLDGSLTEEKLAAVLSYGAHCRFCPSRSLCPKFGQEQQNRDDYEGTNE